ncbi:MAG: TfpX/TfpZ family type IV pilin accessory protein [Hydrogenophaga sp.]|nr:TfpX/TfpZ family type IV pilin accessory protein [Hydrogenophaga sp.]
MQILKSFDWKTRFRAAGVHLGLSALVALLAGAVVFGLWYPYPYRVISGGQSLFWLVVTVDLVLGPLLTWIVFDRRKSRAELIRDVSVIALLQLSALMYGLLAVYQARPVYLVHEVDRFVVVSAADVDPVDLPQAVPEFQQLPWAGVRLIGVRESRNGQERLETLTLALAGKDMSLRPGYWQALSSDNKAAIRQRAKPLLDLRSRSEANASTVDQWLSKHSRTMDQLVFLPMVGRDQYWSAVMDANTLEIIGYLPIDGF